MILSLTRDDIQWVLDGKLPVFDSVKLAREATDANTSIIFVPARFAPDAMFEAADAGISLIVCITEGVAVQDMMKVRNYLDQKKVRLVGPNCPGLLTPGEAKVGIIPGDIAIAGNVLVGRVQPSVLGGQVRRAVHPPAGFPAREGCLRTRCIRGADEKYRLPVRFVTELAWHSMFIRNMFIPPQSLEEYKRFVPDFTVVSVPNFKSAPATDNTNSDTFIVLNFERKLAIVGNTAYAGMKKSIFTLLNYLLPLQGVMSMHCSANVDPNDDNDVALFFGLSGTGKTTLSADPKRRLIGDDEPGWSDDGVFNFEGGCYAKVIS